MGDRSRLYFVEPNGSGGLIHYAYQLCTALANQGMEVTLVTGSEYELKDLPHNFHVANMLDLWTLFDPRPLRKRDGSRLQGMWARVRWTARRGLRALRLVRAWFKLTAYLSREKPDIIQFSKINFPFEAFFLGLLQRRGLILTQICHEFELREAEGPFAASILALYRNVYTHFSAIFFHAHENRERFLSVFPFVPRERTFVIPHGNSSWLLSLAPSGDSSALRARYGLSNGDQAVLFFGLLAPSKGIEDLVDAFAMLRNAARSKLIIAGYPTKHFGLEQLRQRISSLGLGDRVVLDLRYIPLSEIGGLMGLSSVVVYPYRSSTQSGALQVAYTFGRPVIATAVGGLPEAVEDEKSGFLIPVGAPQVLAEKIALFLEDPELAARMGGYARHLSETRFNWDSIARQIVSVYEKLPA